MNAVRDLPADHSATSRNAWRIEGKWYLFAQACGRPLNANYIDGAWEMWGVACDRAIVTRPDCAPLYIPGPLAGSPGP
jgi:hypothetical protein